MENLSKAHDWVIEGWLFLLSVLASFVFYIKHKDDRLLRDYQRKNDQEHSMLWNQKVSTELFETVRREMAESKQDRKDDLQELKMDLNKKIDDNMQDLKELITYFLRNAPPRPRRRKSDDGDDV
jgi:hypothetical protein